MSYITDRHPEGQVFNYTNLIRQAMIAELVAINDYTKSIRKSNIKELNRLLYHIMLEEKEHYGMLLDTLRTADPEQYRIWKEVEEKKICLRPLNQIEAGIEKVGASATLQMIRKNIKSELEAIILYEQHIAQIPMPEIQSLFHEIVNQEIHHMEELTTALLQLDRDPYGQISQL